jgi:RNA polymerase sigma-70 factor, ECF subfamily
MKFVFKRWRRSERLFNEFQAGDEAAYSRIYTRYKRPIQRYVSARIRDPQVCDEVTQEIFLKVHRFRDSYQGEYAFSTWLWTIARNTIADHLRKRTDAKRDYEYEMDEAPSLEAGAAELSELKDQRRMLFKVARALTRAQRRVLWFRIVRQLSFPEIANRLGLSVAAVKNLAHRAKQSLSQELGVVPTFA